MTFHLNEKAYTLYTAQNQKELFKTIALKRVVMSFNEAKELFDKNKSNDEFKMFRYTRSPATEHKEASSQMIRVLEFTNDEFKGSVSKSLSDEAYQIGRDASNQKINV
jgi:hypothetical protein